MPIRLVLRLIILAVLGCFSAAPAQAQGLPDLSAGTNYTHQYARPGRPTISVYVWGAVEMPGTWKVEPDVDLVEFLSTVRVPGTGQSDPRTRKNTVVRIYKKNADTRSLVYEVPLNDLLTQKVTYPGLHDQDVLQVETISKPRFGWRDVGSIIGTASSLLLLFIRLSDL